jgi:hypothetical protein
MDISENNANLVVAAVRPLQFGVQGFRLLLAPPVRAGHGPPAMCERDRQSVSSVRCTVYSWADFTLIEFLILSGYVQSEIQKRNTC